MGLEIPDLLKALDELPTGTHPCLCIPKGSEHLVRHPKLPLIASEPMGEFEVPRHHPTIYSNCS